MDNHEKEFPTGVAALLAVLLLATLVSSIGIYSFISLDESALEDSTSEELEKELV